ncbi:MAG TPA: DUF480 domain-containing protein [Acidimicrobiales bacterium]|nr:DUF480 domain-containing protein [Acidimicrobiales bacterium]
MEVLTPEELRVLAVLLEKEATTPDQYPLTMSALVAGVNQTSNRTPVVAWTPAQVDEQVRALRARKLLRVVHASSGGRAERFRHVAHEVWGLTAGELAVLAVLVLRGPQTVNELTTRTERYHGLDDLGGVEGVLHRLRNRYAEPYVTRLERAPGQREERWAHLLAGEVLNGPELPGAVAPAVGGPRSGGAGGERIVALEAEVAALRDELAGLRDEFARFRSELA